MDNSFLTEMFPDLGETSYVYPSVKTSDEPEVGGKKSTPSSRSARPQSDPEAEVQNSTPNSSNSAQSQSDPETGTQNSTPNNGKRSQSQSDPETGTQNSTPNSSNSAQSQSDPDVGPQNSTPESSGAQSERPNQGVSYIAIRGAEETQRKFLLCIDRLIANPSVPKNTPSDTDTRDKPDSSGRTGSATGRSTTVQHKRHSSMPKNDSPSLEVGNFKEDHPRFNLSESDGRSSSSRGTGPPECPGEQQHQESDVKKQRASPEVFVSLSQLRSTKYGDTTLVSAAESAQKGVKPEKLKPGDFDLVVIHNTKGYLLGCVKPVTGADPNHLKHCIKEAIVYLDDNAEKFETIITSDGKKRGAETTRSQGDIVTKTLILPNVSKDHLVDMLSSDDQLCEDLSVCLTGAKHPDYKTKATNCLCEVDLTKQNPEDLVAWWKQCLEEKCNVHVQDPEPYNERVYRFIRPMRTTAMKGDNNQTIMLTSEQFRGLASMTDNSHFDLTIFVGPPFTGKTTLLVLKGGEWLKDKSGPVFLLKTNKRGCSTAKFYEELVHRNQLDNAARRRIVVEDVSGMKIGKEGHSKWSKFVHRMQQQDPCSILIDDADWNTVELLHRDLKSSESKVRMCVVINDVTKKEHQTKKGGLVINKLTNTEFVPPSLLPKLREVIDPQYTPQYKTDGNEPTDSGPVTNDGQDEVLYLGQHVRKPFKGNAKSTPQHSSHSGPYPWRCQKCAEAVANALQETLGVGKIKGKGLQYHDVFILAPAIRAFRPKKGSVNEKAEDTDPLSPKPFLDKLRNEKVPVRFIDPSSDDDMRVLHEREVTSYDQKNEAIMANQLDVQGLRRRVVVYLDSGTEGSKASRLHAFSRAKKTLVLI